MIIQKTPVLVQMYAIKIYNHYLKMRVKFFLTLTLYVPKLPASHKKRRVP